MSLRNVSADPGRSTPRCSCRKTRYRSADLLQGPVVTHGPNHVAVAPGSDAPASESAAVKKPRGNTRVLTVLVLWCGCCSLVVHGPVGPKLRVTANIAPTCLKGRLTRTSARALRKLPAAEESGVSRDPVLLPQHVHRHSPAQLLQRVGSRLLPRHLHQRFLLAP